MYCVKCGVKLADSEKLCPLCGTIAYHPDIVREEGNSIFPKSKYPSPEGKSFALPIFLTVVMLLPILVSLTCDLSFNHAVTWSGIVIGASILAYVMFVLPMWFETPNPMIFVPSSFVAIGLYLLYLNWSVNGKWFLTFAFPILGCVAAIVITGLALVRYVRKGKLFIFGGACIATGGMMLLIEFLMTITFKNVKFIGWSLYPLVSLVLVGGFLIFLGICRPAREVMERKFFV